MGCKPRPVPADFTEVMQTKPTIEELSKLYRTGYAVVRRWLSETSHSIGRSSRPMPDDFAELAATMTKFDLKRHYKAGDERITRWLKECGVASKGCIRPVPDDFAEMAAVMCAKELRLHYNAGSDRIARWIRETGITPKPYVAPRKEREAKPKYKPFFGRAAGSPYRALNDQRVGVRSIYDDAADTLRRERWIVHRSNEKGGADLKGKFWRVGNVVCTPDELLARAARYERKAA